MPKRDQGQMSIFFAMCFLILITCMAFIVNIGMFVKAKINLQNAVDAAAFSGAAVQARQLSNIAYVNWEMRNIYKEWMFKLYVLGQMANPTTDPASPKYSTGNKMDFRIPKFEENNPNEPRDLFNIPTTCINLAGTTGVNICAIYNLPGLPRFSPLGLVGVDETHNEFMNALVQEKSQNCTKRADFNFLTAYNWVYGTGLSRMPGAPEVAADRPGAYPKAFELAVRIRNLEKIVNEPPVQGGICAVSGAGNCRAITEFHQQSGQIPLNERKVKAFWSAFRNLENNDGEINGTPNLKHTFRLIEIPPLRKTISETEKRLDGLLTPAGTEKIYLDLRLILLNIVHFYTLFSTYTGDLADPSAPPREGQCASTKTGIPVPAYPFGYLKNPEVLTYYAVKGEADYTGLFNPFAGPTKLVAYAAAKPFGGRIGPALFKFSGDVTSVQARTQNNRSFPYFSGLNPIGAAGAFKLGYPMPILTSFWVNESNANNASVGGMPSAAGTTVYGVPNLLYDLIGDIQTEQGGGIRLVQDIRDNNSNTPLEDGGLYLKNQFESFKSNITSFGGPITPAQIDTALNRVKSPTYYEALNYLIPTQDIPNAGAGNILTSAPGIVPPNNNYAANSGTPYYLFAPLWGPGTFFPERQDIINVFDKFTQASEVSIRNYVKTLQDVAKEIMNQSDLLGANSDQTGSSASNYVNAAKKIHDDPRGNPNAVTCESLAGKFAGLLLGGPYGFQECRNANGIVSTLRKDILDYWEAEVNANPTFQTHFSGLYFNPFIRRSQSDWANLRPEDDLGKKMMTAYLPGEDHGANVFGIFPHPFAENAPNITREFKMDRNYYSTKFIAVQELAGNYIRNEGFTIYSEGTDKAPNDILIENFENKIDPIAIPAAEISKIKE